jgi:hypothetical protein
MNTRFLLPVAAFFVVTFAFTAAHAQKAVDAGSGSNVVYRCPSNEYTNDPLVAKAKNCTIVPPNISVMGDAFKPPVQDKPRSSDSKNNDSAKNESSRSNGGAKSSPEQKSRDSDRKRILEDELKSAEDKLAELKKEFNNGEPERRGDERNFAKYQERTAQLKADVTRAEADVSALKREVGNLRD